MFSKHFREACPKNYGLDPPHYVSSPGLAWDAMLKMTRINLELEVIIDYECIRLKLSFFHVCQN